ncbi:MAG: site-specific integrase [Cyanobacteria bacterium P01_D01_bin.50]
MKPGDTNKEGRNKKQYKISLGIPASFDGLKTAEEEAYELGKLIARQTFTWTDKYLGVKATKDKGITFREFYEQFEKRYFEKRKRTIKSENTFKDLKSRYRRYFISEELINQDNLRKIIISVETPPLRKELIRIASLISSLLNLNYIFKDCSLKYTPKKRDVPRDLIIVEWFHNIQKYYENLDSKHEKYKTRYKRYKLIYGLLAVYGLRPREIINQPDFEWFVSGENSSNSFKVHESNKTGYREVLPFVPEWIELFDLKNEDNIIDLKEFIEWVGKSTSHKLKTSTIGDRFRVIGIPFTPYDLRHACAIRAHLQGMPIKAAADNLGHSVEVHTETYQRWFGLENRRKAFEQTFEGLSELDKLKDENDRLRQRITELELEVARLKLLSLS